ncbi:MAG TPA: zf-HC2 domain-containing protein [Bryobacteraceae bacterium]|jgi:hypothetical protein|nr:zf-HC2 domain-containing protein [Bryobacteraceae bacterium]
MDHEQAVKTAAVERYLLGEMAPPERDAFEEHYFSCAVCAEEVRAAAVLTAGMPAALQEKVPQRVGFRLWWWLTPQLAATACAALLLAAVVAYQNVAVIPALLAPRSANGIITLDGLTRAAGPKVAASDPLVFQMALDGLGPVSRVRVELDAASGRQVRAGEMAAPAAGQPLEFFFPGSLDPGHYRVVVREVPAGREIARSGFEVVK